MERKKCMFIDTEDTIIKQTQGSYSSPAEGPAAQAEGVNHALRKHLADLNPLLRHRISPS